MKLDLDNGSKIIGTFPIREGGIITGLTKYIGEEALVVLLPKKEEAKQ